MMTSLWGLGPAGDRDVFMDGYHRYAMWDAAYVLGSLSVGDRREFETHMGRLPGMPTGRRRNKRYADDAGVAGFEPTASRSRMTATRSYG
jgi:hypothetical protein